MKAGLRNLRPSDALRILNSGRLGAVTTDRLLRADHDLAGRKIGDSHRIDAVRYAAWLLSQRRQPRATLAQPPARATRSYEERRDSEGQRQRELSDKGREIGPLPPVRDQLRREGCERSLQRFLETYLAPAFYLGWSQDHLDVIADMEQAILHGTLFAVAMPRGSGKTTLILGAVIWALLYGHRKYVAIIGATEKHALRMLSSIRSSLQNNPMLLEDFPEVCYPIKKLDRQANRANGQKLGGEHTQMTFGKNEIILPTVRGSKASGSVVEVAGLTGAIRGMQQTLATGEIVRPDLAVCDDPQTDESAKNPRQCDEREELIAGAVLGLAGPGKKIAGFMPCTVIKEGDMADRILDRMKHPEWQGRRTKMVPRWPTSKAAIAHWEKYAELRRESFRNGGRGETATAYYLKHRKAMDAGSIVSWEARKNDDEISGLQHAWNLRIDRGERAFHAEYQNEPLPAEDAATKLLTSDEICGRLNRMKQGEIPNEATTVTAFVDIQGKLLVWAVVAWEEDFTGHVVDYGTLPDQRSRTWSRRDPKRTLAEAFPKHGFEASIRAGLEAACEQLLTRDFRKPSGDVLKIERLLIDTSWGKTETTVKKFCRNSQWSNVILPARGSFVGPASKPFSDYHKKRGDRIGLHWRISGRSRREGQREVLVDTNWWKSFVHNRIAVAVGDAGSLSLWGSDPRRHEIMAQHMLAEQCVPSSANGRTVDVWKELPGRENDLFDCLVGCCVAASMQGVAVAGEPSTAKASGRRVVSLRSLWGRAS